MFGISAYQFGFMAHEFSYLREDDSPSWAFNETPHGPEFWCGKCGSIPIMGMLQRFRDRGESVEALTSLLRDHVHPKPKPLTAEQREQVRIAGVHRRGALRCTR